MTNTKELNQSKRELRMSTITDHLQSIQENIALAHKTEQG